ncbi:ATPase, AAA family protein [Cardiosporidium cionae]|uniref:ATPase, AAA family protein n=1 Tax=Cardiosporidium cionae TaxID=476202 RepID=A0ABQ7JCL8_9APIC|nr:ATPase, AAA family protein [Cardiosporidium cionae]|eukprot:KAF8821670.1 ATPase, AAA family protein [Cardiosporidium cionae]
MGTRGDSQSFPTVTDLLNGWQVPVCCEVRVKPHAPCGFHLIHDAIWVWLNSAGPTLTLGRHSPLLIPHSLIKEMVSEILIETAVPYDAVQNGTENGMSQLRSLPLPEKYRQKADSCLEHDPIILMNFAYKLHVIVYQLTNEALGDTLSSETDPKTENVDMKNLSAHLHCSPNSISIPLSRKSSINPRIARISGNEKKKTFEVEPASISDDASTPAYQQWELPSSLFHGLWENLHFDSIIKRDLLEYALTALLFSDKGVDPHRIHWNRLIFLHGPPGTGKTSLCKALAQKLSIRLYERFSSSLLIEINAHSLFSKWYSESGKLTLKLFNRIKQHLLNDTDSFVCVLIDEVESLSAARQAALAGNEPSDSIRVVNALLTQLDALKSFPNCLVLTTSNVTGKTAYRNFDLLKIY